LIEFKGSGTLTLDPTQVAKGIIASFFGIGGGSSGQAGAYFLANSNNFTFWGGYGGSSGVAKRQADNLLDSATYTITIGAGGAAQSTAGAFANGGVTQMILGKTILFNTPGTVNNGNGAALKPAGGLAGGRRSQVDFAEWVFSNALLAQAPQQNTVQQAVFNGATYCGGGGSGGARIYFGFEDSLAQNGENGVNQANGGGGASGTYDTNGGNATKYGSGGGGGGANFSSPNKFTTRNGGAGYQGVLFMFISAGTSGGGPLPPSTS